MKVSIIIVNYNTQRRIEDCLDSIREYTRDVEYEVLVVDNAPDGKFGDELDARNEGIIYLPLKENVGFGMANNAGFEAARGEYLFCLNPDTLLVSNAVKILSDFLESHPRAGACGGNLIHSDGHRALSYRRILPGPMWELSESLNLYPERVRFGKNVRFNRGKRPVKVGYISGADLMIRRETLEQTGGFSSEFFMYFEETDLCCRICRAGWKIYNVPEARIIHLEGESFGSKEVSRRKLEMYVQGRAAYYSRNLPRWKRKLADTLFRQRLKGKLRSGNEETRSTAKILIELLDKHKKENKG